MAPAATTNAVRKIASREESFIELTCSMDGARAITLFGQVTPISGDDVTLVGSYAGYSFYGGLCWNNISPQVACGGNCVDYVEFEVWFGVAFIPSGTFPDFNGDWSNLSVGGVSGKDIAYVCINRTSSACNFSAPSYSGATSVVASVSNPPVAGTLTADTLSLAWDGTNLTLSVNVYASFGGLSATLSDVIGSLACDC